MAREGEKLRLVNNRLRITLKERENGAMRGSFESREVRRLKDELRIKQARLEETARLMHKKDKRIEDLELSNELLHEANNQVEESMAEEWTKLIEQKKALKLAPLVPDTPEVPSHSGRGLREGGSGARRAEKMVHHHEFVSTPFRSPTGVEAVEEHEENDDSIFVIDCLVKEVASSEKSISVLKERAQKAEKSRDAVCMAVLDALNREKAKCATLQTLLMERHTTPGAQSFE